MNAVARFSISSEPSGFAIPHVIVTNEFNYGGSECHYRWRHPRTKDPPGRESMRDSGMRDWGRTRRWKTGDKTRPSRAGEDWAGPGPIPY